MLKTKEVEVTLGSNIKYYESLGYEIPRVKDSHRNRWHVPLETKILVKVEDLPKNSNIYIQIKCDSCGKEQPRIYKNFLESRKIWGEFDYCNKCKKEQTDIKLKNSFSEDELNQKAKFKAEKVSKSKIKDFNIVNELFLSKNYKLLYNEEEYKNNYKELPYICLKHPEEIQYTNYRSLKQTDRTCKTCMSEHQSNYQLNNGEYVFDCFKKKNLMPTKDAVYIGNKSPIPCICTCHPDIIQYISFTDLKRNASACKLCRIIPSGDKHPLWKGGTARPTLKARLTRSYQKWRMEVLKRDNYTCQCCGKSSSKGLHVHHIKNFLANEDLRLDIDNGITLCKECHDPLIRGSFHYLYGVKNNNKRQLDEYIYTYKLNEIMINSNGVVS